MRAPCGSTALYYMRAPCGSIALYYMRAPCGPAALSLLYACALRPCGPISLLYACLASQEDQEPRSPYIAQRFLVRVSRVLLFVFPIDDVGFGIAVAAPSVVKG
jgi:hypothetical protein